MGLELARAFVRVRADNSRLRGDLSRTVSTVASKAKAMAASIAKAMASIAGAVGFFGMARGLAAGAREAATFEQAMIEVRANARLLGEEGMNAMEGVGDAAQEASDSINDMKSDPLRDVSKAAAEASSSLGALGPNALMFQKLVDTARELGATTQFTSVQAANALNQLVLGGLDANEAIGALPNVLNLAASSGLELATAAQIVVDNMVKYNLAAEDTGRIGDFLSSAQSRAQTTAGELADALGALGSSASDMGVSFRDTVAILTGFAKAGTRGQESGTALAIALARLAQRPAETAEALKAMNIRVEEFTDSGGAVDAIRLFRAIAEALPTNDLQRGARAMELFGARGRKVIGMLSLMQRGKFIEETAQGLEDDLGRASTVAQAKMDTFIGTLKELRSALGDLAIATFTPLLKAMEPVIDGIRFMALSMTRFHEDVLLPLWRTITSSPLFGLITQFAKLAAIGGVVAGAIVSIIPLVSVLGTVLTTAFTVATGPIGITLALLTGIGFALVQMIGQGDSVGEKMDDIFGNKIPGLIETLQFTFRNFGRIAQIAILNVVKTGLDKFPLLEWPLQKFTEFFVGTWMGIKAFFSAIIDNMIGGLMELRNFGIAVAEGLKAAMFAITFGNFEDVGKSFTDAFVKTLAEQEDVKAKNAFKEFGQAFSEGAKITRQTFQATGGLGGFVEQERQRLLDEVARDEVERTEKERAKRRTKPGGTKVSAAFSPAGVPTINLNLEPSRLGFAELGRNIQDALLKDSPQKQMVSLLKEQTRIMKEGTGKVTVETGLAPGD